MGVNDLHDLLMGLDNLPLLELIEIVLELVLQE